MIPKIIHYCWLSDDPIPNDFMNYIDNWKKIMPDFEFRLWNFNVFDKKSSNWVSEAFDNKKYAFAADYIRLYAVYNYGGFYMDMDIKVLKPFYDLLDKDLILAYENIEQTGIEAGCFGACKNNSLIKEMLGYYENRHFIKDDNEFDTLPLPRIMKSYTDKYEKLVIKDWHMFTNKLQKTGEIITENYSYAIHNFAGSWLPNYEKEAIKTKSIIMKKIKNKFLVKVIFCIYFFCLKIKNIGIRKTIKSYYN